MKLSQYASGLLTVARRRGLRYFGYLATGVALPTLAYRWGWGPRARFPQLFTTLCRLRTGSPSASALQYYMAEARDAGNDAARVRDVMDAAHRERITGVRHFFGGAEVDASAELRMYARAGICFAAERDADRRAYNARFGTALLTEADAREQLRARKAAVPPGYRDYAPIDFGGGLTIGQVGMTDSGTGRWDFFNGAIVGPLVRGKRILDLGSNNGSLPLMMLRAGARSVTAVEFTPEIADFARLNGSILSWRDMRGYDFQVRTGDMRLFLTDDLGTFDVVTAFCSLYYLPEADMARIIAKAAAMGATLILQANESIDNLPARAAALQRLMRDNGYAGVRVHEYPGFGRPLLVGEPAAAPVASL